MHTSIPTDLERDNNNKKEATVGVQSTRSVKLGDGKRQKSMHTHKKKRMRGVHAHCYVLDFAFTSEGEPEAGGFDVSEREREGRRRIHKGKPENKKEKNCPAARRSKYTQAKTLSCTLHSPPTYTHTPTPTHF